MIDDSTHPPVCGFTSSLRKEGMAQRRVESQTDFGITGIYLPTGEVLDLGRVKSMTYNPNISALRFSFTVTKHTAVGVDKLTNRVNGVQTTEGRCVCRAHKFFRHNDTIYIQDADISVLNI